MRTDDTVLAASLGFIHRGVSRMHQHVGIGEMITYQRRAHARRDRELVVIQGNGHRDA